MTEKLPEGHTEQDPYNVLVARFPQGRSEDPDSADWLITTVLEMNDDPRIKQALRYRKDDTPITMSRNDCLNTALENDVDFLLMLDSDMSPDCNSEANGAVAGFIEGAKPFWKSSFDFAVKQRLAGNPCTIGAPYLGPSPHNNVYVFQWTAMNDKFETQPEMKLAQFGREEAARMRGITEVAALPTGVILIDMLAVKGYAKHHKPPFFYYEWADEREMEKASTEDVTFTRDMSLAGFKQYCNWDAWAGHWKRELVKGPPGILEPSMLADKFCNAVRSSDREKAKPVTRLMEAKDGKVFELNNNGSRISDHSFAR